MAQTSRKKTSASTKKATAAGKKNISGSRRNKKVNTDSRLRRDIWLLILLAFSLLLLLSNFGVVGIAGRIFSSFFFGLFGLLEYIFPVFLFFSGAFLIANRENSKILRKVLGGWGFFAASCVLIHLLTIGYQRNIRMGSLFYQSASDRLGGGLLGGALTQFLCGIFGTAGTYVIVIALLAVFAILITQKPLLEEAREKGAKAYRSVREHRAEADLKREERKRNRTIQREEQAKRRKKMRTEMELENLSRHGEFQQQSFSDFVIQRNDLPGEEPEEAPGKKEKDMYPPAALPSSAGNPTEKTEEESKGNIKKAPRSSEAEIAAGIQDIRKEISTEESKKKPVYQMPPLSLLKKGSGHPGGDSDAHLRETARKLQQTLHNFGVDVTVTNVSCGPSVTRYEIQPEQGVKVSRIVGLSDDIKLNLAAADIRIEAPIPGKAAVGIEVPNKTNSAVMLRSLLESQAFRRFPSKLAFAVGKDIAGQPVVTDIAKMPHLLIAGATGSGKSVCINTLIMSILYKASPEEVKLIMIDPKVVELSVYNGIPHLYIPVVTDPKKAAGALNWAVSEMTDRYNKFAEYNVRDLAGYNAKVRNLEGLEGEDLPKELPQIVIIVDELADLMMVAPGEVEDAICRLAQLARAAGLHLIIATQRPSVNVITGLIKANMPSRIALAVASGVDSRTILDMNGAEKLLGKGDMLFYPQGYQKPARVQGAFVSDEEIVKVVDYLSARSGDNIYDPEIEEKINHPVSAGSSLSGGEERDSYFTDAGKLIIEKDKASIGMLQRAFKIGFNRAARIMDQLSDAGVVGDEEGTKPRKILMTMEQFENYLEEN